MNRYYVSDYAGWGEYFWWDELCDWLAEGHVGDYRLRVEAAPDDADPFDVPTFPIRQIRPDRED